MSGEFVWRMEDVLDLYAEPHDPKRPVICLDEASKELHAHVQEPLPAQPGRPRCEDYEYERRGTANLFMMCCPRQGWRQVQITDHRTAQDFAHQLRDLSDIHFPEAEKIRLVLDNLNTHTPGALYQTFAPQEAYRLARRFEFHYTPKHASWLNIAEMEWSVLTRQVLDQRIPDASTLSQAVNEWTAARNADAVPIRWCFSTDQARTKLKHLYPVQLS
jgi:DDE superfamily endonuclease